MNYSGENSYLEFGKQLLKCFRSNITASSNSDSFRSVEQVQEGRNRILESRVIQTPGDLQGVWENPSGFPVHTQVFL